MVSPKFNGMPDPPFGVRTHAQPEAMTGIPVPAVFDFYPGIP